MKEIATAIDAGGLRGTFGKESGLQTQVPSGAFIARHLGRQYIQCSGLLKSEK